MIGTPDKPGVLYRMPEGRSLEDIKADFRKIAKDMNLPYRMMHQGKQIECSPGFSVWGKSGVTFHLDEQP